MAIQLGTIGIWRSATQTNGEFAAEVEKLGYGALWLGGSPGGDLAIVEELLDATEHLAVATGIVNIWADAPESIAKAFHRIEGKHPGRFLLGVGAGHPEATQEYKKPYAALVEYLDALDTAGVPKDSRALAALGPKVLKLAGDRTAGAHPYLTTPEHTRSARELLGAGPLIAPEHKVVYDTDVEKARALGRKTVQFYLKLSNYTANLRKLGFTDEDLAGEGSDRLVDALVLHGDAPTIAAGVRAHLDAGADHVNVQVLDNDPFPAYRALAAELF
ncbi:LLM class F420-dependent oxidoreductase [Amycolatopsis rhabdoformis]|uniref:LLM class F420-dependent oxidoreductase n=1 Tax=Amycolatopsis rhabdoformis TaxID=1448059 RepID=A0ABZ1I157_9PSEU|nr:LLM class F420-dependent oxidoreductase [Amycolatopsis rhabdoformis]WSE28140.1 LLM class F420-dependent oxidoreductase [Amycolatopsis rhabdoformis]